MKLSTRTINILSNFALINQSAILGPGKSIQTNSPAKDIRVYATIVEDLPLEICIYDLKNFLSVMKSIEESSVEFGKTEAIISDAASSCQYRYASKLVIRTVEPKTLNNANFSISLDLSAENLKKLLKMASILSSVHVLFDSKGTITVTDLGNSSINVFSLDFPAAQDQKFAYKLAITVENLAKILLQSYKVSFDARGLCSLLGENMVTYYIGVDKNFSTIDGKKI